ncbi:hypothetical protein KAU33_03025 [Candidatus Dependentiae bacterium]|nr:hypothetical protein [Candidatus Dependentiae bacterium]
MTGKETKETQGVQEVQETKKAQENLRLPRNHFEKIIALSERIKLLKSKAPHTELIEIDFFSKALEELKQGEILITDTSVEEVETEIDE